MGDEATFIADSAGLELIRATAVFAVNEAHKLGCYIAVVVWRPVS